jgi:hypothetical protein
MTDANKSVATVSKTQGAMIAAAKLPRTLMGGTKAMREAGTLYLPKEPAETQAAYDNRKARSTLFNAFGKTVEDMTGKVFQKEIQLADNVPQVLQDFAEDIDLTGRHLNLFARDLLYDGLQVGGGYILVDAPPPPQRADKQPATKADYIATKWRPYLKHIPVENLIGWKSTTVDGAETLTQVRISECVTEEDGPYLEKEIAQIRVIEPGTWQTFRKSASGDQRDEWIPHANGTNSLTKITLVPFYANRTGFMTFSPPLEKLADTNVAHWQSQSDQRNILHVARVPVLFAAGFDEGAKWNIGASEAVQTTNPNAKLTYVEHTGHAIDSGDKDLENLERQMEAMGLHLLTSKKSGAQSATGEIRDDSKENSPLAMMARALEDAIECAFGYMGEYIGLGADKGGEIEVNKDFGVASMRGDLQQLNATRAQGDLSRETLWDEMQRRDYLGPAFDPEREAQRLADEAPTLAAPPGQGMDFNAPGSGTPTRFAWNADDVQVTD